MGWTLTQVLIFLLILAAALVLVVQLRRWKCTWAFIVFYWALLTVKNMMDLYRT